MPNSHSKFKLVEEIISMSRANTWDDAKREWEFQSTNTSPEHSPGQCLCGHRPIHECCVLKNTFNGNEIVVGNVCVRKFLSIEVARFAKQVLQVRKNPERALSIKAVEFAFGRGWIDGWERNFLCNTARKRRLSTKQLQIRVAINKRLSNRLIGSEVGNHA